MCFRMWGICYLKEFKKKKNKKIKEGKWRLKILVKATSFNILVIQLVLEKHHDMACMISDKIIKVKNE